MLRLPTWRWPFARGRASVYCVLVFPDSTESRWVDRIPTPGMRLQSDRGGTYVVDGALQSGKATYTVFLVDQRQHVRNLREGSESELATELLDLARRTKHTVDEARQRWKYRDYLP